MSSTPLSNGKTNGTISNLSHSEIEASPTLKARREIAEDTFSFISEKTPVDNSRLITNNNINNNNYAATNEIETRLKRRQTIGDKAYFIMKELLATERTYKKDLDVLSVWFREEVSSSEEMPDDVLNVLFSLVDPLSESHTGFLRELEQRMAVWDGRGTLGGNLNENPRIIDLLVKQLDCLPLYEKYMDTHLLVLERMDAAFRKNKKFEMVYREFELQRVCYLPLSCFLVKPLQRLLHYYNLIDRLSKHYGENHIDYSDCQAAFKLLQPFVDSMSSILKTTENFVQLSELQRDMPSFEGLVQCGREFIRQGCLLKNSRKGFQQRMFFLFSDVLVYTNRTTNPQLQFKVHGQMPLRGVMIDDGDERSGANFSFTIFGGNRTLVLAANSQEEKDKWLADLFEAINIARERNDGKLLQYLSLKSCSSSDEAMELIGASPGATDSLTSRERISQQRSNTTVHVCWHRNTSTSLRDHIRARGHELSGFLLRKFKNSDGWQKLWVVFTHFCLFFYKTYLEEAPLASLPLLGYAVSVPGPNDDIGKEFVFKLQFKNHVYFFRAESEYTFLRWMEVINSATQHSGRIRLFSRKESSLSNYEK